MRDYKTLRAWQVGHKLALAVYAITQGFPPVERFGLSSQMRRSAFSVPTNIAEGCGREGRQEYIRFLRIAAGSAAEIDYQLLLARDLGLLTPAAFSELGSCSRDLNNILGALIASLST